MSQDPNNPQGPQDQSGQPSQPEQPSQPAQPPASAYPPPGDYSQASPPAGAYPPPADGGFAPLPPPNAGYGQPAPGYGQPNPGYGQPGQNYSQMPGTPQATESLSAGWEAFKANPWPFVIAQLLWGAIFFIPILILLVILSAVAAPSIDPMTGEFEGNGLFVPLGFMGIGLVVLVVVVLAIVMMAAFASATLKTIDGHRVAIGDFFKVVNFPQVLLLALLIGLAAALLSVTIVGTLVVTFFGSWAVFFVVDRGQSVIDAIKSSVSFAMANAGQSIVLLLLGYLLSLLGSLACGIGALVTSPVTMLGYAHFYRRITGPGAAQAAPPAPQWG